MRIRVKNLGVLKDAQFELGDLTIICGENNTGKTYATYALYGFLATWQRLIGRYSPRAINDDGCIADLMKKGGGAVNVGIYTDKIDNILRNVCRNYAKRLPRIFASSEDEFADSKFSVSIDKKNITTPSRFERRFRLGESLRLSVSKDKADAAPKVSLTQIDDESEIPQDLIERIVYGTVIRILLDSVFPRTFIASAERTGTAIFRKELDRARDCLIERMKTEKDDLTELLDSEYADYPLPVADNLDFTRDIESITRTESFLSREHTDVLKDFANIIGGSYEVVKNQGVSYIPEGKSVGLSMGESSSSVRSMLNVGFYLRHFAQRGDLLMIEEPELNLHPENQRRVARLFARLVNLGIKVFITTHSDYIIKELNALIMLNQDKRYLKEIKREEGFKDEELLSYKKVKVYIAKEDLVKLEGNKRRTRCQTLVPADITQEQGIEVSSFDETINKMNEIEEAILWGE